MYNIKHEIREQCVVVWTMLHESRLKSKV